MKKKGKIKNGDTWTQFLIRGPANEVCKKLLEEKSISFQKFGSANKILEVF